MIITTIYLDGQPILRWESASMMAAEATADHYATMLQADRSRIKIEHETKIRKG